MLKKILRLYSIVLLVSASFLFSSLLALEPTDQVENAVYNARLIPAPRQTIFGKEIVVVNQNLECFFLLSKETIALQETTLFLEDVKNLTDKILGFSINPIVQTPQERLNVINESSEVSIDEKDFVTNLQRDVNFWNTKESSKILAIPLNSTISIQPEEIAKKQDQLHGRIIIAASDLDGLKNSFKTLQQLAESLGYSDSIHTSRYIIPELLIDDAPSMSFRGIHLCWFPETDARRIEQAIRTAAYYKFNHIVLEFWGTFPFESTSGLYWQNHHTTKEEVKRLVKLGKRLGINLIPQLNIFGHATGARVSVGKHVALDFFPEMEPYFEPDGWTWNVYNPEARKLLTSCILELYETFDSPKYFHIGCDEAYSAGTSFTARRKNNYVDALAEWLIHFHELLKEKNCRLMMWHDMLIEQSDFSGYIVGGNEKTRGLIERIPKDILICDWQYGAPKSEEKWPTSDYFQKKGFDFIACPWRNVQGIKSLAQNVIQKEGFGILCTTWHTLYGNDMRNIFIIGSQSAWGTTYKGSNSDLRNQFNRHLRQATRNVLNKNYQTNGVNDWQVLMETHGPEN